MARNRRSVKTSENFAFSERTNFFGQPSVNKPGDFWMKFCLTERHGWGDGLEGGGGVFIWYA